MTDKQDPSDAELFLTYAKKHGFEDTYAHLLSTHERTAADPLELLVQAKEAHEELAKGTIDDAVTNDPSPYQDTAHTALRIPKAIAKGTWYAIKNTKLYYPFVAPIAGALPATTRDTIAQRLGDNPKAYIWTNIVAESLAAGIWITHDFYYSGIWDHPVGGAEAFLSAFFGIGGGALWFCFNTGRIDAKRPSAPPSPLYIIPYYITATPYFIAKGVMKAARLIWKPISEGYMRAWHEETSHARNIPPALPDHAPRVRINALPGEVEDHKTLIRVEEARDAAEEANQKNESKRAQAKT